MAYLNLMYREKGDVECDDLAGPRRRSEDSRPLGRRNPASEES